MKLIIDISDETYDLIAKNRIAPNPLTNNKVFTSLVMGVILNGTPLTESDDCVSREAVLDALKKCEPLIDYDEHDRRETYYEAEEVEFKISTLPSVSPKTNALFLDSEGSEKPIWVEREKGEWIKTKLGTVCNKCYRSPLLNKDYNEITSNFCPFCGADMRGEKNDKE